jgi:hypothetical protein
MKRIFSYKNKSISNVLNEATKTLNLIQESGKKNVKYDLNIEENKKGWKLKIVETQ